MFEEIWKLLWALFVRRKVIGRLIRPQECLWDRFPVLNTKIVLHFTTGVGGPKVMTFADCNPEKFVVYLLSTTD